MAKRQSLKTALRLMRPVMRQASQTDFTTPAQDRALQQVYAAARAPQHQILLEALKALDAALDHQVSNRSPGPLKASSFYTCYTYPHGQFPVWVDQAESIINEAKKRGLL